MKILYIIGNGFDLNLGLKTSYKDFYDYYRSIESEKINVNNLKSNISNNYKNWSDLELALGSYTKELKTLEDFDDVFEDIGEQLAQYLKRQEAQFDINLINQEKFFEKLLKPEDYLPQADKSAILSFKNNFINTNWFLDIFTFNYTKIIDNIIGNQKNLNIRHPNGRHKVILRGVEHIHGYYDNRMILGVNDISQLKNKEFHRNEDVLEAIIKERCNKTYRHTIDDQFKKKIQQADLICVFGSSIGDTDKIWWESIGNRLKSDIRMIIFTKGEEAISPRIGYKNSRTERKMRNLFLEKTKLSGQEKGKVSNNIYVALDSPIFKDLK